MAGCVERVRHWNNAQELSGLIYYSEVDVKVVNMSNMEELVTLKDHPKPVKHLSYDPTGKLLAASCTNGMIYLYSMTMPEPALVRCIDGVVKRLETAEEGTSRCVWHPDGRTVACATATHDVQIVSVEDGANQRTFSGGHRSDITSMAWSPNGALLATSSADDKLVIWETKTQSVLKTFNYEKILNVAWHNQGENLFNWTNSWGEVTINPNFLQDEQHLKLLRGPGARSPFFHDPNDEVSRKPLVNGQKRRAGTPDSLDELLGPGPEDEYDWIEDDDNAGYTNGNGKRTNGHLGGPNGFPPKRSRYGAFEPIVHPAFQPSSTPWRGNRKYLSLNLIGFVWTVDQDTHHTVTVEFYDREQYRDFHFTDPFKYDKACLNETGTLFSCPANNGQPAMIFYRPHETWTNRSDWRISLPDGEEPTSIALSSRYIVATTSANYVRVWTLFGTPIRVWRLKASPAVTCAAHSDYVITVANSAVDASGSAQLVYSIDNVRHDDCLQNNDLLPLPPTDDGSEPPSLQNIFFSDTADPCIYDSAGVLLTLSHWRTPGQARWVPLLDTKLLSRLQSGKKEETYWPVAVAGERFHCIILKGGEKSPYFPRPLLTEFDFQIPVGRPVPKDADDEGDEEDGAESNAAAGARLEESLVRSSLLHSLLSDSVEAAGNFASHVDKTELARREIELDKVLLQLLAVECREGEDRGMKALEVVRIMKDRSGRMLEAAAKVAGRWGHRALEDRIREVAEQRMSGMDDLI